MKLMYISSGQISAFDGAKSAELPSQRIQQYRQTLRQLEKQHAWKSEGSGAQFMHQRNPYANAAENAVSEVTGFAPFGGCVIYAVNLGYETGGFYRMNPAEPDAPEGLVCSAVRLYAQDLIAHGDAIYAALREPPEQHIIRLDPATGRYQALTEGDTLERHPFICADGSKLFFDMRGIARDEQQQVADIGPSSIVSLDLRSGELTELCADPAHDYLKYTESADGVKRVLVRPHKESKRGDSPLGCLLAPFSAIVGFIHVFSAINAARKGKQPPMAISEGEAAKPMNNRLTIDGVPVDLEKIQRDNKKHGDEFAGIVPRDWRLVEIRPDGAQETLQHGVLDYAPLPDGGYVYSNGAHILRVAPDGKRTVLVKAHLATNLTPVGME